jgi:hypothetical protein
MKSFLSKISSTLLALLMLVSTVSFTVDAHYCGNILVDKAILGKAETCQMHQQMPAEEDSHCCDNEVEVIEGQNILQFSKAEFDLEIPLEFVMFSWIHFSSIDFSNKEQTSTKTYIPPQYAIDFQVLNQVFLI